MQSVLAIPVSKEIIIVDDGSTDHTRDVIAPFFRQHKHIVWVQQHNQGVSIARNIGIDLARGRYTQFVDGDDILLAQDKYPNLLKCVDEQKIDIVRHLVSNNIMTRLNMMPIALGGDGVICSGRDYLNALLRGWFPHAGVGLYRTQFLQQNAIRFPEKIGRSEDAVFLVDAFTCRPDVRVLETRLVTYWYRTREGSETNRKASTSSFVQMCGAGQLLWQRMQRFGELAAQTENAQLAEHYRLLYHYMRFAMLHEYSNAYDNLYRHLTPDEKDQVRHCFTPEVLVELRATRQSPMYL